MQDIVKLTPKYEIGQRVAFNCNGTQIGRVVKLDCVANIEDTDNGGYIIRPQIIYSIISYDKTYAIPECDMAEITWISEATTKELVKELEFRGYTCTEKCQG